MWYFWNCYSAQQLYRNWIASFVRERYIKVFWELHSNNNNNNNCTGVFKKPVYVKHATCNLSTQAQTLLLFICVC